MGRSNGLVPADGAKAAGGVGGKQGTVSTAAAPAPGADPPSLYASAHLCKRLHAQILVGLGLGTLLEWCDRGPGAGQLAWARAGSVSALPAADAHAAKPGAPLQLRLHTKRCVPHRPRRHRRRYDFQLYSGLSNTISGQFLPKSDPAAASIGVRFRLCVMPCKCAHVHCSVLVASSALAARCLAL